MKLFLKVTVAVCVGVFLMISLGNAQTSQLLRYQISCPDTVRIGDTLLVELALEVQDPWYTYAPGGNNEEQGMHSIRMEFTQRSSAIRQVGAMGYSPGVPHGAYIVYKEGGHTLSQKFIVNAEALVGRTQIVGQLHYQVCNAEVCYPPMSETLCVDVYVLPAVVAKRNLADADVAWDSFQREAALFRDSAAYKQYKTLAPLAMRRFEDDSYQHKAALALAFWDKYPSDARRMHALKIYLSADPWFIAKNGNASLEKEKSWKGLDSKAFIRSIAIDTTERAVWLRQGEAMVTEILQATDSSLTAKETASFLLFARDYRMAASHFGLQDKMDNEFAYWQPLYDRLVRHFTVYASQTNLPARAQDFLTALKGRSPAVAASYWQGLLELPRATSGDPAGIHALRQTAREQLAVLGTAQGKEPLSMTFTALDGRVVDLKGSRGKVVLIDFWATWCKPCLEELPRLKALYEQYQAQGFDIIGICLDDAAARTRVEQVIKDQGITWTQRFEGKGFSSDSYRLLYGINSLPTVWLLDKQGKVIDANARGEKLEPLIRKHLEL